VLLSKRTRVAGFLAGSVDDGGGAFGAGADGDFCVADFSLAPDGVSAGSNVGLGTPTDLPQPGQLIVIPAAARSMTRGCPHLSQANTISIAGTPLVQSPG